MEGQFQKRKNKYKFIVLGRAAVGKSSITIRYCYDNFTDEYNITLQDTFQKKYNINDTEGQLEILDTAGQEDYIVMQEHWIKEGQGFILVYSITDHESFLEISQILNRISKVTGRTNMPTIIVGNKSDLGHLRKVEKDEVLKIIDKNDYLHLECSAKEGTNCQQVFENLLKKIIDKEANRKHRRPDSRTKCSKCGKKCRGKCTRKSEKNKENEYICMCNIF